MIRVLIADDHVLFRRALLQVLQRAPGAQDIEIVGEASTGREAIACALEVHPHVALLDVNMPDGNGFEATKVIRKDHPDTQVLILSAVGNQELLQLAATAGAVGYLTKDTDAESLIAGIHAAHEGKSTISPKIANALLRNMVDTNSDTGRADSKALSPQELRVLTALVTGLEDKLIAAKLSLSESTVKTHLRAIYRKLGARNRAQAVVIAVARGLVGSPPPSDWN